MSYSGPARSTDEICFPSEAVLRMQPRAAGPLLRELVTTSGPYESTPIPWSRGLLIIDPRYDRLPLGPGFEWQLW